MEKLGGVIFTRILQNTTKTEQLEFHKVLGKWTTKWDLIIVFKYFKMQLL